jgi:bifunctional UDP-N-acetylglucosamine pyrophosphorylase/glucosamine-1-phosphate N-acetyltransferase
MIIRSVILAAGQGTRMHSSLPKVLHPLLGRPLVWYSLETARRATNGSPTIVVGHEAGQVMERLGDQAQYVIQNPQRGTGHAVLQAKPLLEGQADLIVVTYADMPLITSETLERLIQMQSSYSGPITITTLIGEDPRGFGRVVRDEQGQVREIVEEAQASPEQLAIKEYNASVYCFRAGWLWDNLERIPLSRKGEYYLTDLVGIVTATGQPVQALIADDEREMIGINTRVHLSEAETALRERINRRWMLEGVTMTDPATAYIEVGVTIGRDTTICANTHLHGNTRIGSGCQIGPDAILTNTTVGNNCKIFASVLEDTILEDFVEIGPYQSLAKGTHIPGGVRVGN